MNIVQCTRQSHNPSQVGGICVSENCPPSADRVCCLTCHNAIHSQCSKQDFLLEKTFIERLKELKASLIEKNKETVLSQLRKLRTQMVKCFDQFEALDILKSQNQEITDRITAVSRIIDGGLHAEGYHDAWYNGYNYLQTKWTSTQIHKESQIRQSIKRLRQSINQVISLFDRHTKIYKQLVIRTGSLVSQIDCSPINDNIVCTLGDKLQIHNLNQAPILVGEINGHSQPIQTVKYTNDGQYIVSGGLDKKVCVWYADNKKLKAQLGTDSAVNSVACSNVNDVVLGCEDGLIQVWNFTNKTQLKLTGHRGAVTCVIYSHCGCKIVSGSRDLSCRIWDASNGQQLQVYNGHSDTIISLSFSSNGLQIISVSKDKSIQFWNPEDARNLDQFILGHNTNLTSVAFSLQNDLIVSGSRDDAVIVEKLSTGKQIYLPSNKNGITCLAFSQDGSVVLSAGNDNTLRRTMLEDFFKV